MSCESRNAAIFAAIRADIESLVEEQARLQEQIDEIKKLLSTSIKDTSTLEPIL
jgi:hypothetical protein